MSRSLTPDDPDQLVPAELGAEEKSETRLRTVPPRSVDERALFDVQLREAESKSGERARGLVVRIGGVVGSEPALHVLLTTAPEGPDTPAEDVWSDPVPLVELAVASADSARERVRWAIETSKKHALAQPQIEEHWNFGARPFLGDADGLMQLLDARLRLVTLAFEGCPITSRKSSEFAGPNGQELVITVELRAQDERELPIVCELLRQPKPEADLVLAAGDWTTRTPQT